MHPFRRLSPLALALLALGAWVAVASAQLDPGVYLKWDQAFGDGGVTAKDFDCDVNTGYDELVGTFVLPYDLPQVVGLEATLDIIHSDFIGIVDPFGEPPPVYPPIAPWWQLQPGGCRASQFTVSGDFSAEPFASSATYEDFLQGRGLAFGQAQWPVAGDSSRARIRVAIAMPEDQATALTAGHAYFGFRVQLRHTRTTGSTTCPGCCQAAVVGLSELRVVQPVGVGDVTLAWSSLDALASWQFGNATCVVVPARPSTWGELKTRYR